MLRRLLRMGQAESGEVLEMEQRWEFDVRCMNGKLVAGRQLDEPHIHGRRVWLF